MSALELAPWLLSAAAALLLLVAHRRARRRAEAVLRACHELRQPLQAVLLALGAPTGVRPGTAAMALELERAARAAEQLAGQAQRRPRRHERRPVDVGALVALQARLHDAVARAAGRRIVLERLEGDAVVRCGDRGALAQAVGNLLSNALEHGRGEVRVSVLTEEGRLCVTVGDDGPGLPAEPHRLVRGRGRHGRGLAIARQVARDHGGRLARDGRAVLLELAPDGRRRRARPRSAPTTVTEPGACARRPARCAKHGSEPSDPDRAGAQAAPGVRADGCRMPRGGASVLG